MNATRPVNRLPAEVLAYIFSFVPRRYAVFTETEGRHWPFDIPDIDVFTELATVCKHWRSLFLDTPSLWSVVSEGVSIGRQNKSLWHLSRCPRGPLTVNISGNVTARMWRLLRTEGHRIQQLHLGRISQATDRERMLSLLLSLPADVLQHCKIHLVQQPSNRQPLVPLFSGKAENLQSLYLDQVWFLPSTIMPQLTYLTIFRYYAFDDPLWNVGDLLRFLSGSPELEELHLSHVWGRLPPDAVLRLSTNSSRVILRRLRVLTIAARARFTASIALSLLPNILLPQTCRIQLGEVKIDELDAISPALVSLGQPFERARLTLERPFGPYFRWSAPGEEWAWSLILASSQTDCGGVWLRLESVGMIQVHTLLGPSFRRLPFLENVEEFWFRSNICSVALLRRICLPPKVHSLVLTILNRGVVTKYFIPIILASAQLDTLCVCVVSAEQVSAVKEALTNTGPKPMPQLQPIRRVAVGYGEASRWYHKKGPSLRSRGAGYEVSWIGQIPKQNGKETEMDRLFRVVPELLNNPATVLGSWPEWS